MTDIMALLTCLGQSADGTTRKQLERIVVGLLSMSGRVTMLGIARWSEAGGSYRTGQRFFDKGLPWGMLLWLLFRHHLLQAEQEYIIAGDETVVSKAGKQTPGLDRFFSSLYGKPIRGLSFFVLSLVSVEERHSYPLLVEQRVRSAAEKAAAKQNRPPRKGKRAAASQGRPKGSKNRDKSLIEWTPELRLVQGMVQTLVGRVLSTLPLAYRVLDGHFGNNNTLQMVRQSTPLHLISKLRSDAALYCQYEGQQKQFGPRRRYGDKLTYQGLPDRYRVASSREGQLQTDIYQATVLHKSFAQPLNVVIVCKRHLLSGAHSHVILFSSDLSLPYDRLLDFYQLRFQLEFNFRDAKQFWGLEDWMNVKPTALSNAVNLSFFMVNLSPLLLRALRHHHPRASVLDLKAFFRGRKYAVETLNLLPSPPDLVISQRIVAFISTLGSIHRRAPTPLIA